MIPPAYPSSAPSAAGEPPRVQEPSSAPGSIELPLDLSEAFEARAGALRRGDSSEPPETLGGCYEALRQGSLERRRAGAHYTPFELTGPIVRATLGPLLEGLDAQGVLALRVVDPAMGAGAFLAEVCRVLAAALLERGGATDGKEARRKVATACLYGVDIDPVAVVLARRVLWLVVGDPELELDFLDASFRQGDALVGEGRVSEAPQDFPSPPFHWHRVFPEVFEQGGFDASVGNPPFRNAVEARVAAAAAQKAWWRSRWPRFSAGSADRSLLFWARCTRDLLNATGRYGMLSPTALLSSRGLWQAWMFENWRPDHLWLEPVHRFEGARVRTTAIIGGAGSPRKLEVRDRESDSGDTVLERVWPVESPIWYALTRREPVELSTDSCIPLSRICSVRAGCATGAAYQLREHVTESEGGSGLRLVTTGALDRYTLHWGRRQRFLGADYRHPRWPLGSVIPAAVARARDAQSGPKILVGGLTRVLEAWLDPVGDTAGIVSTWVIQTLEPDAELLHALLVVLNSPTASRIYRQEHGGAAMSGAQVTIKKQALVELLVPRALLDPNIRRELADVGAHLLSDMDEASRSVEDRRSAIRVGRIYGRSEVEAESDIRWWQKKGGFS